MNLTSSEIPKTHFRMAWLISFMHSALDSLLYILRSLSWIYTFRSLAWIYVLRSLAWIYFEEFSMEIVVSQQTVQTLIMCVTDLCLPGMFANAPLCKFTIHAQGQSSKKFECKIGIIFLSISKNLCFGCSKESSHRDDSFEYPQHMFWLRNKKKFSYALLSVACTCFFCCVCV